MVLFSERNASHKNQTHNGIIIITKVGVWLDLLPVLEPAKEAIIIEAGEHEDGRKFHQDSLGHLICYIIIFSLMM
ncbi:hypothetical protein ACHQM5_009289 [Ranunculus cassubicifolius]